jgi:hypothetical protein
MFRKYAAYRKGIAMETLLIIIIVDLVLFLVLLYAMKEIMKQALSEFKAEIIQEFGLQNLIDKEQRGSASDNNGTEKDSAFSGQADMNRKENE